MHLFLDPVGQTNYALIGGVAGGSAAVAIILVVLAVFIVRKRSTQGKSCYPPNYKFIVLQQGLTSTVDAAN